VLTFSFHFFSSSAQLSAICSCLVASHCGFSVHHFLLHHFLLHHFFDVSTLLAEDVLASAGALFIPKFSSISHLKR
jgi:hypothetical protein